MPTGIEWATEVWNPVTGCTKVSPGCAHCYAARMAKRLKGRYGYPADEPFRVTLHPDRLDKPLHWRKPRRVFVCSMGDLFHEDVPDRFIEWVFAVMASCGQHTFMLLTKRPERMKCWFGRVAEVGPLHANEYQSALIDYYSRHGGDLNLPFQAPARPTPELRFIYDSALGVDPDSRTEDRPHAKRLSECHWRPWPLNNVQLGVTAETQEMVDARVPVLLEIPAAVRFVSCEPLLGPLDLTPWLAARYNGPHAESTTRRSAVPSGPERGVRDRRRGPDMAACDPHGGPLASGVPCPAQRTQEGGEADGEWVPPSADDDRGHAASCVGPQTRVSAFQRVDIGGNDREPSERPAAGQQARESCVSNVLGADATRRACSGARGRGQAVGHRESPREADDGRCAEHQAASRRRADVGADRHSVRCGIPDDLEDHPRAAALSWVITGAESGPGARPSHPDWFRSLRDQCSDAGVPFLFKQWGDWATVHDCDALGIERVGTGAQNWGTFYGNQWCQGVWDSTGVAMQRVGKKAAGRMLDGVVHDERPGGDTP